MVGERASATRPEEVRVLTTAAPAAPCGATWAFVVRDRSGLALRKGFEMAADLGGDEAAYEAVARGLEAARAAGACRVSVYTPRADVVAAVTGPVEGPAHVLGRQLQVRALLHCFRSARVKLMSPARAGQVLLEARSAGPLQASLLGSAA